MGPKHALGVVVLVGCGYDPVPAQPTDGAPDVDVPSTMILKDRGLVVRYFMDEAASGQTPQSLTDSASAPLALPITYGQATFIEDGGHRGLHWPAFRGDGKVEIGLGGTKLDDQLSPAETVTIEVVAQITGAGAAGSSNESQITGLRGGNPDFVLAAAGANDLRFFRPFGNLGATWIGANDHTRMVLHLIFDSTRTNAEERIELFKNGTVIAKTMSSPPNMGQDVGLGGGDALVIGNRQSDDRSIEGTIFYVAYYNVALDAVEIANNAQRLLADDDR